MSYHEEFIVVDKEIGNVIEISQKIAMWKIPSTIEEDLGSLYAYLQTQNQIESMGIPYTHYTHIDWEAQMHKGIWQMIMDIFRFQWDLRIGIPTSTQVLSQANMQTAFIPKQKYLETIHYGPYQKLGRTYKALYHYAKANDIKLGNNLFEFYQNNPKEVKPYELQTTVMVVIEEEGMS